MPRDEENYVGLFIDWDNLAISTAVDFAGAVPDVRAIVRAAQRFGTVLISRAYAEWNVSSDRLSVYRAGIEPIFAPTFRFESEPGGTAPRGKSLADPCLVADCIDTMHLMPAINVFVLVSGDKDLIPIVRLVQLRGKRVVVIGPDFVAAILREMADEYIPYRLLAEASENPPTEVSVHGARGHRRVSAPAKTASLSAAGSLARQPSPTQPPPRSTTLVAPSLTAIETNGSHHAEPTPAAEPALKPAPPSPTVVEETLDTGPLFTVIANVLREREEAGKPRLRATNLKDQLLARISGFNEHKYGFSRFKDLLAAADKAGILNVTRTGPVQWVTSATPSSNAAPPQAETETTPEPADGEEAKATVMVEAEPVEATAPDIAAIDPEVVRFVVGLRERSRWLTYTYVLTNLLNHLGNGSADASSDAEARVTLNRLVQEGILVVDREPREIDVNGTRHRVRLCHVVETHPLVAQVVAEPVATQEAVAQPFTAEATEGRGSPSSETEMPAEGVLTPSSDVGAASTGVVVEAAEPSTTPIGAEETTRFDEPKGAVSDSWEQPFEIVPEAPSSEEEAVVGSGQVAEAIPTEAAASRAEEAPASAPSASVSATIALTALEHEDAQASEAGLPGEAEQPSFPSSERDEGSVERTREPSVDVSASASEQGSSNAPEANGSGAVETAPSEPAAPVTEQAEEAAAPRGKESNGKNAPTISLSESYAILRQVVLEATDANHPTTGPAAVKNRLVRRLGAFDERAYGFSKFKDYLLSAERAGAVRLEISGTTTRVALPADSDSTGESS